MTIARFPDLERSNLIICCQLLNLYKKQPSYFAVVKILDCDAVVQQYNEQIKKRPNSAKNLVSILTSEDPWSVKYQHYLEKDSKELGFSYNPQHAKTDEELLELIKKYNTENSVDGILLFYPLGKTIQSNRYCFANEITPKKDVEGLNCYNMGRLLQENGKVIAPATAEAVVSVLQHHNYIFNGKLGLIINRSDVVGKPLRIMLEHLGMTVTAVYEETDREFIADMISKSDLVVTAVSDEKYKLPNERVKKGSAVIAVNPSNIDEVRLMEKCSLLTSREKPLGRVTRKVTLNNLIKLQEIFR